LVEYFFTSGNSSGRGNIVESTSGSYLFNDVADAADTYTYAGINTNIDRVTINIANLPTPLPDLAVGNATVGGYSSPSEFNVDEKIEMRCAIYNYGTGASDACTTGFYLGNSASDLSNRIGTNRVYSIAGGSNQISSCDYTFQSSDIGTKYIIFVADYNDEVNEDKENNNKTYIGPFNVNRGLNPGTIVSISPETASYGRGGTATVSVTVSNPDSVSHNYWLTLDINDPSGTQVMNHELGNGTVDITVPGRNQYTYNYSYQIPVGAPMGTYDIVSAGLRDRDHYTKWDEEANWIGGLAGGSFEVGAIGGAIVSISTETPSYTPGGFATVSVTVSNPDSVSHNYWLTLDINDPSGTQVMNHELGNGTVDITVPGRNQYTYNYSYQIPVGAPTGTYDIVSAGLRDRDNYTDWSDRANWIGSLEGGLFEVWPEFRKWTRLVMPDGEDYGLYVKLRDKRFLEPFTGENPENIIDSYYLTNDPDDPEDIIPKDIYISTAMYKVFLPLFNRMPYLGYSDFGEKVVNAESTYYVPYTWGISLWKQTWKYNESLRKEVYSEAIKAILQMEGLVADSGYLSFNDGQNDFYVEKIDSTILKILNDAMDAAVAVTGDNIEWDRDKATVLDCLKVIYKGLEISGDVLNKILDDLPPTRRNAVAGRFDKAFKWMNRLDFGMNYVDKIAADVMFRAYLSESEIAEQRIDILSEACQHVCNNGYIPNIDPMLLEALTEIRQQTVDEFSMLESIFDSWLDSTFNADTLGFVIDELNKSGLGFGLYNRIAWKIGTFIKCHEGTGMISQNSVNKASAIVSSALIVAEEWREMADVRHKLSAFMTIYNVLLYYNQGLTLNSAGFDNVDLVKFNNLHQLRLMHSYALWFMSSEMANNWSVAPEDWLAHAVNIGLAAKSANANFGLGLVGPVYAAANDIFTQVGEWVWSSSLQDIKDQITDVLADTDVFAKRSLSLCDFLQKTYLEEYDDDLPDSFAQHDLEIVSLEDIKLILDDYREIAVTVRNLEVDETYELDISGLGDFASINNSFIVLSPRNIEDVGTYTATVTVQTNTGRSANKQFNIVIDNAQMMGALAVNITPPSAISSGALWRVVGETFWLEGGDIITDIPVGNYQVQYVDIPGWIKPLDTMVEILEGHVTEITGEYAFYADPVLAVNPSNRNVSAGSGNSSFDVWNSGTGTMDWTASVILGSSWLSITSGSSGTNTGTITCAFSANTSTMRTGIIRVETNSGQLLDLNILQAASYVGSVQLSSENYAVSEDDGIITITATRTGGSSGAVSVNYTTGDDTASSGSDYSAMSGTMSWSDGDDTDKTFTVTILDNSIVENNKTFTVTLNYVNGVSLGNPTSATVTIVDDETANFPCPQRVIDISPCGYFDFESGYGYLNHYSPCNCKVLLDICDCTSAPIFTVGNKIGFRMTILTPGVYWLGDDPVRFECYASSIDAFADSVADICISASDLEYFTVDDVAGTPLTENSVSCPITGTNRVTMIQTKLGKGYTISQEDGDERKNRWWLDLPSLCVDAEAMGGNALIRVQIGIFEEVTPLFDYCPTFVELGMLGNPIIGTVTESGTDAPLSQIGVYLYDVNAETYPQLSSTLTDSNGRYSFSSTPGEYKIHFYGSHQGYVDEWYNDKLSEESADVITVTGTEALTVNAVLEKGGTIAGTVTESLQGLPLDEINLELSRIEGDGVIVGSRSDRTKSDGTYALGGLAPGNYKLLFLDYNKGYLQEWYDDKASQDLADVINITGTETVTADAVLSEGASISGTVRDQDGNLIVGSPGGPIIVTICLCRTGDDVCLCNTLNDEGFYEFKGLSPGDYTLSIYEVNGVYLREWYENKSDWSTADTITLSAGEKRTIDLQISEAAKISGTVTDAQTGDPVQAGNVYIYNATSGDLITERIIQNGSYTARDLSSGIVKIYFDASDLGYINEWHNNSPGWQHEIDNATSVALQAPNETIVNAQLERGGGITGRVASVDPAYALSRGYVVIATPDDNHCTSSVFEEAGTYDVRGLPSGQYKVGFFASGEHEGVAFQFIPECYDNKLTKVEAQLVTVTAPGITRGIDAQLTPGGTVAGHVRGASGKCLQNRDVSAFDLTGHLIKASKTEWDGSYQISGLLTGSYKIRFGNPEDWMSIFYPEVPEWYDNQPTTATAQVISVTAPNRVDGIDAVLEQCASLSGHIVTDLGAGLGNISVRAYDAVGIERGRATSLPDGIYSINCLPSGSFRIHFDTGATGYVAEWYHDHAFQGDADFVPLLEGEKKTGIDAELGKGSSVTGTLIDENGMPLSGIEIQFYSAGGSGGLPQNALVPVRSLHLATIGRSADVPVTITTSNTLERQILQESDLELVGVILSGPNGEFSLTLPQGLYKIFFSCSSANCISCWYNNKNSWETADIIEIKQATTGGGDESGPGVPIFEDITLQQITIENGNTNVQAIPTLSEWGMLFFALLIAGAAFMLIRRRNMTE